MGSEIGGRGRGCAAFIALALVAGSACANDLHDPTRPDVATTTAASSPSGWRLGSTLVAPHRRVAVVNGDTVQVGDRVDGATVAAILPGAVRLRTANGTRTVKLISTTIKTTTGKTAPGKTAPGALDKRHPSP